MRENVRDPRTPAEWQDAANAAQAALLLDSARQYGLVTGSPAVHVNRCEDILSRARDRGITPHPVGVDAHIVAMVMASKLEPDVPRETSEKSRPTSEKP
jgi:hypothetical protein